MIRLVVDNTRSSSSPFLVFVSSRGMPTYAANSIIETLRDLSIDLARKGSAEPHIRSELLQSADFMVRELFSNFFSTGELAQLVRLLGLEIDRLLELVQPLKAVPQDPIEKPAPVAQPGDDGIIDVEFEIVDDPTSVTDCFNGPILFAQVA